jgi:hypothetical protein
MTRRSLRRTGTAAPEPAQSVAAPVIARIRRVSVVMIASAILGSASSTFRNFARAIIIT